MVFWVAFAVMTAVAALAVLLPLMRRSAEVAAPDLAIYRDQLAEVDRDLAGNLITAAEAEAARVEVKRRLLTAADRAGLAPALGNTRARRWAVAAAGLIVVPAASVALYVMVGMPDLPDQPLAARQSVPSDHQNFVSLVQQVEKRLADNPEDGRGWEVMAPIYLRSGRYDEAVKARQNALRLLGATPEREADLGEALFAAAEDKVTAESRAAFERALALDPQQPKARYFLGVADQQAGRPQAAAERWKALLADAPPNAPWRAVIEQALAELATAKPLPGPRVEKAANAPGASASAPEQPPMVRAMVEMLAARLKTDRGDVDGWLRLLRAYSVLGDTEKTKAAVADARAALADDPEKLKRIEDLLKDLGING